MQQYYIQLFSLHGLIRGHDLELGRDADSGGQITYAMELLRALSAMPEVRKVDLFTRLIADKALSSDYAEPTERINDKARIVRIQCGGRKYMRKERLWPHLDEYVDKTLRFIKQQRDVPDVVHGHYADAGYVADELGALLGLPFVFTGHSLGLCKKRRLAADGLSDNEMNRRFRIDHRIRVEEAIIGRADRIVASTNQEVEAQYRLYATGGPNRFLVLPPGIDIERFRPFYDDDGVGDPTEREHIKQARYTMEQELRRFLRDPLKPLILALSRPDRRKNIAGLITAYGNDKALQAMANLAVFAGIRRDIADMEENECEVLTELLLLMDKYDLYGKMAIPKRHDFEHEVPELYRIAARTGGIFVNPAFTEPFGLTLIEAAASGLPIVATNDGGPRDIVANCDNGLLVNPSEPTRIAEAATRVLSDPHVWKACSHNGVLGVRRHYTWERHCRRYIEMLRDLPDGKAPDMRTAKAPASIGRRLAAVDKLFVSDIDDTLLGDTPALEALIRTLQEHRDTLGFCVASGRTPQDALRVLRAHNVPDPDVIIGSVGTEIFYGPLLRLDRGWQTHISAQWNRESIRDVLSAFPYLEPQPESAQRPFKLSYYLETPDADETLHTVHAALREANTKYTMVYSGARYLDVLPFRASKGKAIRYLEYKWSIALDHILTAGDSGNDADMLRGEILGIVVANHQSELDAMRGMRNVYFASRSHAGGILEGMTHYGFLDGD